MPSLLRHCSFKNLDIAYCSSFHEVERLRECGKLLERVVFLVKRFKGGRFVSQCCELCFLALGVVCKHGQVIYLEHIEPKEKEKARSSQKEHCVQGRLFLSCVLHISFSCILIATLNFADLLLGFAFCSLKLATTGFFVCI